MRHTIAALFVLLACARFAESQVIPTTEERLAFRTLERYFVGASTAINVEIASLRSQLARCSGAGASGNCASRTLMQAKLNYLLKIGMALGDPDTAGAPPKPTTKPTDATDYETELQYLQQQLSQEPRGVYVMSENRAKYWIILHCKAMKETYALMTYRTPEEVKASMEDDRTGKTKANVNACTKEYDAKAIAANRKTAFEYCLPATTEKDGGRLLLNLCMHKHDMLTAMCKQQVDFMTAWRYHKDPQAQHAWGVCPADRVFVSPSEVQAITAAPPVRTMSELPPRFFTPPDVAIAPRPLLPIPAGTVIELTIQGSWDGAAVERLEAFGRVVPAMLDQALVVGGKEILGAHSAAMLKGRIIGSDRRFDPIQNRPDTVQIAFTTDEINIDRVDCSPCGKWADLKSNEVVFTVPYPVERE